MKIANARPDRGLLGTLVTLALLVGGFGGGSAAAAPQEESTAPLRYARVTAAEARVRNLADERGVELAQPPQGALLAVHRELAGWLEVEQPGGFAVWVYGQYLQTTAESDVYEVTRPAVNMRPKPRSEVTNFPLPQRLWTGDRVRAIELFEPDQPLEGNWVRIWSPAGVRAWIRADSTTPLAEGEDGAALWAVALAALPAAEARPAPVQKKPVPAAAEPERDPELEARQELERARTLLAEAAKVEDPDYAPARRALEAAARLSPSGAVGIEARAELERLSFHEEASDIRGDLVRARERLAEEARRQQAEVLDRSRQKDPLGGVFLSRGLLTRQVSTDGTPRYFLRFGGETASELLCAEGRYKLDDFAGYEIGVFGAEVEAAAAAARGFPLLLIERLEVVARR